MYLFKFLKLIYLGQRERKYGEGGEIGLSGLCPELRAQCGTRSHDSVITT